MKRLAFLVKAKLFGIRYSLIEEQTNLRSLRHLFGVTLKSLIFAVGFAGILQFIDPYFHSYYQKINISIPEDGDYVTFLATVSGIGGVFIGLYYAGISVVGSAIYAKVPNNIRDLLAQERIGNQYMRFLSFLTYLGLVFIAFRILGLPRVYLAVPLVMVLAGVGVIAFVKLGQRAFYLFDPTQLSYHIFEQLKYWLGMVKVGGYQWSNKSFQNHAHRHASATLNTLETLADITAKEPHLSGKPFVELSQNLLRFLMYYEQSKESIPTDSAWFAQQYQHRDWYRTEDSQVSIAHHTGTLLQPDFTTNREWVENKVLPILKSCISVNLKEEKYSELLDLLNSIDTYTRILVQVGDVQRAFEILNDLLLDVLDQLTNRSKNDAVKDKVLEKMAVVELLVSFSISMALGFREHLKSSNRQHIERGLVSIRWNNNTSIYRQGLPAYCLARLEWLKPRLDFEKKIDGKYITPLWYRSDLVCQVVAERFVDNTKALVATASALYNEAISEELLCNHPWLAAAIMSQEWEYWHKVENQMVMWEEIWSNLVTDRKIMDLKWSKFEFDKLKANYEERQMQLLNLMSKQSLLLALLSRPKGFPDYAGQFLHTSGEVAIDALLSNRVDLLKSVFEPYLHGCMLRFDSLHPKTENTDWWVQQELKIAAAALLDLMAVSGYAKLLADYHGNDALWNEVVAVWDKYLETKDESSLISLLASVVAITDVSFEIPHRGVLRTAWKQKINSQLREVPRHEVYYQDSISSYTVIDHDSALVRIFAQDSFGGPYDGVDVLITFYFHKIDGAKDIDFGLKRRNLNLQESIEIEEQRSSPSNDGVDLQ